MVLILSLGIFIIFFSQPYVSADTTEKVADVLLSKDNANSFLQKISRNRRQTFKESLSEECCDKTCTYGELNGYTIQGDEMKIVLCELSLVDKKPCRCHDEACAIKYACRMRLCGCGTRPKDPEQWQVTGIEYHENKGSMNQHPVAAASKIVDNLHGEAEVTPTFSITTEVTEEESFSHTAGAALETGATFSVGVPVVTSAEISTSLTLSYEHSFEKTTSKTEARTSTLPCPAPPHRYVICEGMINVVKISVPYTMTLKHKTLGCTCQSQGMYKNVHHTSIYLKPTTYKSKPNRDETYNYYY